VDECKPLPPQPTMPAPLRPNPRPHTKLSSAARLPAGPTCHPRPAPPRPQSVPRARAWQTMLATSYQAIQPRNESDQAIQRKKRVISGYSTQEKCHVRLFNARNEPYQAIQRKKRVTSGYSTQETSHIRLSNTRNEGPQRVSTMWRATSGRLYRECDGRPQRPVHRRTRHGVAEL